MPMALSDHSSTPKNKSMQPNRLFATMVIILAIGFASCDQEKTAPVTSSGDAAKMQADAKKIEVVKSFYPLLEKGDWDAIAKITSADFTSYGPWTPSGVKGRDSVMAGLKDYRNGFPDMKYEILSTAVSGDKVFVQYRFTGSNNGSMMGMPATNKKVDFTGVDIVQVADSVATAYWDYADHITYQKQMGFMP